MCEREIKRRGVAVKHIMVVPTRVYAGSNVETAHSLFVNRPLTVFLRRGAGVHVLGAEPVFVPQRNNVERGSPLILMSVRVIFTPAYEAEHRSPLT